MFCGATKKSLSNVTNSFQEKIEWKMKNKKLLFTQQSKSITCLDDRFFSLSRRNIEQIIV